MYINFKLNNSKIQGNLIKKNILFIFYTQFMIDLKKYAVRETVMDRPKRRPVKTRMQNKNAITAPHINAYFLVDILFSMWYNEIKILT